MQILYRTAIHLFLSFFAYTCYIRNVFIQSIIMGRGESALLISRFLLYYLLAVSRIIISSQTFKHTRFYSPKIYCEGFKVRTGIPIFFLIMGIPNYMILEQVAVSRCLICSLYTTVVQGPWTNPDAGARCSSAHQAILLFIACHITGLTIGW